ncbi:MAG: hypothetical protein HPY85_10260 [Anaerolineae bacterium]|nr:hypothetical protein [Anaerolineae bacterium]
MPDDLQFDFTEGETLDETQTELETAAPERERLNLREALGRFRDGFRERVDVAALPRAFWTVSSVLALLTTSVLLAVLIGVAVNLFPLVNQLNQNLVGSLYNSFVDMDNARIQTTIPISAEVPAQFDLQLDTYTSVVLSEDVYIEGASVDLRTGGMVITGAPTDIKLPKDTELPVHLVLTVPVDEMIPVVMDVAVDIPVNETDLHQPFQNLQKTLLPYYIWMWSLPDNLGQALSGQK